MARGTHLGLVADNSIKFQSLMDCQLLPTSYLKRETNFKSCMIVIVVVESNFHFYWHKYLKQLCPYKERPQSSHYWKPLNVSQPAILAVMRKWGATYEQKFWLLKKWRELVLEGMNSNVVIKIRKYKNFFESPNPLQIPTDDK